MATRRASDEVAERLAAAGVPSPGVDAARLVEHVDRHHGGDAGVLEALVARRVAREPLQQILGRTWFRHLEVRVAPGVFVPRPETEIVAGVAVAAARSAGPQPLVIEPCTGTGVIALAIASEVPRARIMATDRSEAAVALARRNLADLEAAPRPATWRPGPWLAPGARAEVLSGDLFDPVPAVLAGTAAVVVCNPPYLPTADAATWAPEVADHDPPDALIGGPDGHEVVDRVLEQSRTWLRPGGTVVVEIDDRQGRAALDAARRFGFVDARLEADLTGRDRAVVARRPDDHEETT